MISDTVVIINNKKIKNIWAVADTNSLYHKKLYDHPPEVIERKKQISIPNKGPRRNEYWLDSIEIKNFNILIELKNGNFIEHVSLALCDPNSENNILPFKPVVAYDNLSQDDAEYVVDYYRNNDNCDPTDNIILEFESFMRDFEKRIEKYI